MRTRVGAGQPRPRCGLIGSTSSDRSDAVLSVRFRGTESRVELRMIMHVLYTSREGYCNYLDREVNRMGLSQLMDFDVQTGPWNSPSHAHILNVSAMFPKSPLHLNLVALLASRRGCSRDSTPTRLADRAARSTLIKSLRETADGM